MNENATRDMPFFYELKQLNPENVRRSLQGAFKRFGVRPCLLIDASIRLPSRFEFTETEDGIFFEATTEGKVRDDLIGVCIYGEVDGSLVEGLFELPLCKFKRPVLVCCAWRKE